MKSETQGSGFDRDVLDPEAVVAEYRRLVGFHSDPAAQLMGEPLTPIVAVAGVLDFITPVALLVNADSLGQRFGWSIEFGGPQMGLALAMTASIGFLIANSGDDCLSSNARRISKPFGIFTGLILRGRMKKRRILREGAPVAATDPVVLGTVARHWAEPMLRRADEILTPRRQDAPEDGGFRILGRLGDEDECEELARRTKAARATLRTEVERTRTLLIDPSRAVGPPLAVMGHTLTELRNALTECERVKREGDEFRRGFRERLRSSSSIVDGPVQSLQRP